MDPTSQRLARQHADHAAAITALRAVRERLRGQRISARTDDPQALARAVFMLIDIAVAVMLAERLEAGRTQDEARAEVSLLVRRLERRRFRGGVRVGGGRR